MKKEKKTEIYHIKVSTFRRTLELRIGGDKEGYKEVFDGTPYEDYFELTSGFYYFDEDNNCNIIWLRDYNLNTLVHELIHCVEHMCEQVGLEMKGEPPAFIYEELFTKIMIQCGDKFKLDDDTEWFFKH